MKKLLFIAVIALFASCAEKKVQYKIKVTSADGQSYVEWVDGVPGYDIGDTIWVGAYSHAYPVLANRN